MDHDHAHMDHGSMDHGGMDHPDTQRCEMNMLFNWTTKNLCIIFHRWHITSTSSLLISLAAIILITAGYEALRESSRRYESWVAKKTEDLPRRNQIEITKRAHVVKAVFYATQTFYAFMLMLLFMTYNGWVMIAMFIGSFLGYLAFGGATPATKETACH